MSDVAIKVAKTEMMVTKERFGQNFISGFDAASMVILCDNFSFTSTTRRSY